jgi:hypothetical protein
MDATIRVRRWYRNLGLVCLPIFLAWSGLGLCLALTDPDVWGNRAGLAALMGGIPLFMGGLSLWMLAAYSRQELSVTGDRLVFRGVIRRTEINLRDVTEARWRSQAAGGNLLLRSGPAQFSIALGEYESDDRTRLVLYLRSVLPPEVQTGWNLFEYRYGYLRPRPITLEPGPDEVLVHRGRWTRLFVPFLLVVGFARTIGWCSIGELRFAAPIVGPLLLWGLMKATTPSEGIVIKKLSAELGPDSVRFLWFLLFWLLVGIGGVIACYVFRSRPAHPDAALIVGAIIWFGAFLVEGGLQDRRRARHEQEAADREAKARGGTGAGTWPTD